MHFFFVLLVLILAARHVLVKDVMQWHVACMFSFCAILFLAACEARFVFLHVLLHQDFYRHVLLLPVLYSAFSAFFFACPFVGEDDGGAFSKPKAKPATDSIQHPPIV